VLSVTLKQLSTIRPFWAPWVMTLECFVREGGACVISVALTSAGNKENVRMTVIRLL
jgi:hypothetical protein